MSSTVHRDRRIPAAVILLLVLLMTVLGPVRADPAQATAGPQTPAVPEEGPYLGALLDWAADSAAGHAERLGAPAAVYGRPVPLPMSEQEQGYLRDYFGQVAAQGAHALLTIRPEVPLARIDDARASVLAAQVADVAEGYDGTVFIRFAPQMNVSWVPWGQQPEAYTEAFRTVATAFDDELEDPVLVWSPTAAEDYPFRAPSTTGPEGGTLGALDTTGDGSWDSADDAYGPYYPGDDVVDWVGLSIYHDETRNGPARNTVPPPGRFAALLGPAAGTGPPDDADFYARYAVGRDKPLMVETGAFYSPDVEGGPSEEEVKSSWWTQALAAPAEEHDRIGALVWNESVEDRDEGALTVDWRVAADEDLATAFAEDLDRSGVLSGPVVERSALAGTAPAAAGAALDGAAAWSTALAALAVALVLCLLPQLRSVRRWAYAGASSRDVRIDMLRGMAIVFVVVNHVALTSLFQLLTQESIGVISGAELFVLLSGAVLGMVYGPRVKDHLGDVVDRTSRRAWKLYVTALVVVLLVYALSRLPFLDATAVTTFTDQGTGAAGAGAAGTVYDLYAGLEGLTQFPVPAHLVPSLLLLQIGPWQFNIMGLYVILLALSPLVLAALARGRAWLVLAISLGLYAVGTTTRFRLLPSQFENSFPLLVWQVLFVLGMVAGYYRHEIVAWFSAPSRRVLLVACVLLTVALAAFSWSSPYFTNAYDVRLALLPESTFRTVYDGFFGRTYLGIGRLVNVLLVIIAGYALLTAYWRPLERLLGWFLVPLGQATLYVFILHVFLILAAANIPALQQGDLWLNSAAYVVILGLLWVMVRTRFLFRIIPR
ncbi:OpgC domain-containing protein [Kocuria sp. NPDC057446]|uniref:OpgC domain-containing protein n=1 Tax=Kocuria sp. NPDC057446 TaxID=3346137 RepID=UPI00369F59B9